MVLITSQIEIASPPEIVREIFLDFPNIPEWTQGFIRSIEPHAQKATVEKGDKLKIVLESGTFNPIVLENSTRAFTWRGSLLGLFVGEHSFRFETSKTTPGSTTFTHEENFSGPLAFLMNMSFGAKTATGFEGFNNDLKRRVESRA